MIVSVSEEEVRIVYTQSRTVKEIKIYKRDRKAERQLKAEELGS